MPIQAKLSVSSPHDLLELEADRVADEVMRMADPSHVGPEPVMVARAAEPSAANQAFGHLEAELGGVGEGQPLAPETRAFFEPRFGRDFSHVQIHSGDPAARSAHALGALAYTVGDHVVFGENRYAPGSEAGKRLLAHELAHVVQQGGAAAPVVHRLSDPDCGTTTGLPMAGSCSGYVHTCNSETFVPGASSALHVYVSVDYASSPGTIGPEDFSVQVRKCGTLWDTNIGSRRLGPNIPGCLEFTIASVTPGDSYYLKIYSRSHLALDASYYVWQGTTRPSSVPPPCSPAPV
jgi:Domain of unknown function (DUF4157)